MRTRNITVGFLLLLFVASVFTTSIYTRRNNQAKFIPTRSPSQTATTKPTPLPSKLPAPKPTASGNYISVYITYYGWNDNDPPGTAIAYPKGDFPASIHNVASGTGSFDNPVTFASDPSLFPIGTKIYIPYIKKYAVMEDLCAGCTGTKHIDIWAGGNGNNEDELTSCEEYLTRDSEKIELNPPPGREVNTIPLFNSGSAVCLN